MRGSLVNIGDTKRVDNIIPKILMYPNATNKNNDLVERELSYKIVGVLFKTHKDRGRYCRERQYADTVEQVLKEVGLKYQREMPILVDGRKSNFVDFCIEGKIFLDLKSKSFITKEDYYQMQRYLVASNKELGIIANFRQRMLKPKRVLNGKFKKDNSGH